MNLPFEQNAIDTQLGRIAKGEPVLLGGRYRIAVNCVDRAEAERLNQVLLDAGVDARAIMLHKNRMPSIDS